MADEDADTPALLEWLSSVDVAAERHHCLGDLADGEALLRVMHDLDPEGFPSPDGRAGHPVYCPPGDYVVRLLEGLETHLRNRGAGDEPWAPLLVRARAGLPTQPASLAKLVLVATVENDLPRRRHYVETIMRLSVPSQEVARSIVERFQTGAGLESPSASASAANASADSAERPRFLVKEPSFTPPSRSLAAREMPKGLPDFMEVGLDADSRFRRLKEQYISAMEEQERLVEERSALKRDLEAERTRRRDAEEAERVARTELRLAEEARGRVKEEQRNLFDLRLEQEAARYKERLQQKEDELEGLREDVGLLRGQAVAAERLGSQLEICKQKLEETHGLRRENDELKVQLEEILARPGAGGGDHLHRAVARAREEALAAVRERDEAQRQGELLREELGREQDARRKAAEGLEALRRGGGAGPAGAGAAAARGGGAGPGQVLAAEAGAALLAAAASGEGAVPAASAPPSQKSPKGSSVQELKQLLHTQKDDLLERLLTEKERATRAETTLQAKAAEAASMAEHRSKDAVKLAALEAQIDGLQTQLSKATGGAGAGAGAGGAAAAAATAAPPSPEDSAAGPPEESSAKVQELQSLLALRDRELQVLEWRGQSESQALVAQESFMAACFHELGLKYQRLMAQNEALQRRLKDGKKGS